MEIVKRLSRRPQSCGVFAKGLGSRLGDIRGMTMIEVMVGIVLTSILVLALSGTWAMVSDEFFKLTLKQKAAFVLNGEMERLVGFMRYSSVGPGVNGDCTLNSNWATAAGATNRCVYSNSPSDSGIGAIVKTANMSDSTQFSDSNILYFPSGTSAYNVIWLDRERNITAHINWDIFTNVVPTTVDCHWTDGSAPCRQLTLYLTYPFRYHDDNNPIVPEVGQTWILSLKTIIGGI